MQKIQEILTGVEMTFPTVSGSNLLREKLTLPQDFQGKLNLLFIPFEQWHKMEVDSWMALAKELEEQFDVVDRQGKEFFRNYQPCRAS